MVHRDSQIETDMYKETGIENGKRGKETGRQKDRHTGNDTEKVSVF